MPELPFHRNIPIIIVDDDPIAIFLTQEILLDYDDKIQFSCFTDTDKFLAAAPQLEDTSIILLDLNMPRKNGWTLIEELRNSGLNFPIIVLTASINDKDRERTRSLGLGFLHKPLEVSALITEMENIIFNSK
jgi:CheY-like chemotaxis protein